MRPSGIFRLRMSNVVSSLAAWMPNPLCTSRSRSAQFRRCGNFRRTLWRRPAYSPWPQAHADAPINILGFESLMPGVIALHSVQRFRIMTSHSRSLLKEESI
jgi:hypothetical protein